MRSPSLEGVAMGGGRAADHQCPLFIIRIEAHNLATTKLTQSQVTYPFLGPAPTVGLPVRMRSTPWPGPPAPGMARQGTMA